MSRPRASTPTGPTRKVTKKKATKKKATKKKATKRKATKKATRKKATRHPTTATAARKKATKVKATKVKASKVKTSKVKVAKKAVPITDVMKSVPALRCPECWDAVYSRGQGDYRRCGCGNLLVTGTPDAPFSEGGEGLPIRLNITVSRKVLLKDIRSGYNNYGRIRFPNHTFTHVASRLFPVSFGSTSRRNGTVRHIMGELALIQPRSTPQGAAVYRRDGAVTLWADAQDVWGKVAYTIRDTTIGETIGTTSGLVKLVSLKLLLELSYDTKLRAFRTGWVSILQRYARENPEWFLNPPPVKDFIFMEVLSHGSASTPRGYERGLEGKRRMGKLIPSIMNR